ncbi:tannase-domain-containing protein [Aspergillus ellipticus CBS 707.79]|uniref:Carboxylic ester hydrolase n=1 Tax=Aspergillus ellipticus CBS 707.79 TaxID=1448320 RepID=A0A319CUU2_9EURO|nr:tannase-domain-containing protein [Aspergillus ellipticus CBS 707.79]
MNTLNHYPPACILDYFTTAVTDACDALDGVTDGVISALSLCHFDPYSLVDQTVTCNGTSLPISTQDAEIVAKSWQGAQRSDGSFLWYGVNPGASLDVDTGTTCTGPVTNCTGAPFAIGPDWIKNWVLDDADFDITNLTWAQYSDIFDRSVSEYEDLLGSNNPDLSAFRAAGGKIVHWHGGADYLIPTDGSIDYYQTRVGRGPPRQGLLPILPRARGGPLWRWEWGGSHGSLRSRGRLGGKGPGACYPARLEWQPDS